MTMSDPLGDMLARIRNGQRAKKETVTCPASKLKASVLAVLESEGYIRGYKEEKSEVGLPEIRIDLKYDQGVPVIREVSRISRPGLRIYKGSKELPRHYNGLGISVVSTPRGVMADHEARNQNVGGEVLCQVF
jgi:small subunit ribosomal protein S8